MLTTGGDSASMYWVNNGGGVACQKFTLTWRDTDDQSFTGSVRGDGRTDKISFVGSATWDSFNDVLRFTHNLGTGYLSVSIMDVNNVYGGGENTYVDMGNDIIAKYVGDDITEIDFGQNSSPSNGNVFKIVFIGQED